MSVDPRPQSVSLRYKTDFLTFRNLQNALGQPNILALANQPIIPNSAGRIVSVGPLLALIGVASLMASV